MTLRIITITTYSASKNPCFINFLQLQMHSSTTTVIPNPSHHQHSCHHSRGKDVKRPCWCHNSGLPDKNRSCSSEPSSWRSLCSPRSSGRSSGSPCSCRRRWGRSFLPGATDAERSLPTSPATSCPTGNCWRSWCSWRMKNPVEVKIT